MSTFEKVIGFGANENYANESVTNDHQHAYYGFNDFDRNGVVDESTYASYFRNSPSADWAQTKSRSRYGEQLQPDGANEQYKSLNREGWALFASAIRSIDDTAIGQLTLTQDRLSSLREQNVTNEAKDFTFTDENGNNVKVRAFWSMETGHVEQLDIISRDQSGNQTTVHVRDPWMLNYFERKIS